MCKRRTLPPDWITPLIITTYLRWHQESGRQSDTTIKTYRGVLNRLAYWLSVRGKELLQADEEDLRQWRSSLTQRPRSVVLYVTVVQGFYRWAVREGYLMRDPAYSLPVPKRQPGIPRPIPEDPLTIAIEQAEPRIRIWLILAAYAGLRACEIARLRREDLYLESDGRRTMVVLGKGDKERRVGVSAYVWYELVAANLPAHGALFRSLTDGRQLRANRISSLCNDHLHDLDIPYTLHKLRHRFASRGQRAIGDSVVTKDLLGHASLQTVANYAQADAVKATAFVDAVQPPGWR